MEGKKTLYSITVAQKNVLIDGIVNPIYSLIGCDLLSGQENKSSLFLAINATYLSASMLRCQKPASVWKYLQSENSLIIAIFSINV